MRALPLLVALALVASCGTAGGGAKEAGDVTHPSPDQPESTQPSPALKGAQKRFVDALRRKTGERFADSTDQELVQYGRDFCGTGSKEDNPYDEYGGNPPNVEGIASAKGTTMIGPLEEHAVRYLCPKYLKVWRQAMNGFDDGDHTVGGRKGIKPGTYRTLDKGLKSCYWERTSTSGQTIANDFVTFAAGYVTVTIAPSDGGFTSKKCYFWVPVG